MGDEAVGGRYRVCQGGGFWLFESAHHSSQGSLSFPPQGSVLACEPVHAVGGAQGSMSPVRLSGQTTTVVRVALVAACIVLLASSEHTAATLAANMAGLAIMHSVPKNASWVELWWADSNSIELLPQTDDWLDRALGYQRQQNNVLRLAGIAYLASGRLDKATQLYDAEIQGDSLDRFQALVFGLAFYRQGQTDRALQVWHTGDVSGDEVVPTGVHDLALLQRLPIRGTRTYYTIGEYCQRQGQWLEALMAYELAAKPMRDRDGNLTTGDDPLYRMIAFYQSGIIYTELNEWESAAEMMQAALAVRPEVAPSASADHITALSHLYLARMLEQLGGRERALGEAVEAIAVSPTLCDAYSYVLWLLESQTLPLSYEEQEQIDAVLTQARRQLPHDSSIWEQHVRVYCAMGCADLAGRVVMEARRAGMELPQGMSPCCQ